MKQFSQKVKLILILTILTGSLFVINNQFTDLDSEVVNSDLKNPDRKDTGIFNPNDVNQDAESDPNRKIGRDVDPYSTTLSTNSLNPNKDVEYGVWYEDQQSVKTQYLSKNTTVETFTDTAYTYNLTKQLDIGYVTIPFDVSINDSDTGDLDGSVWFTDYSSTGGYLNHYDSEGNFIGSYMTDGTGNGQCLIGCYGLSVNDTGYVYVGNTFNDRVEIMDGSGSYVSKFGTSGTGDGQLDGPSQIDFFSNGSVLVVDNNNDRIAVFDINGNWISNVGSFGTGDGQFDSPQGVAVDSEDNFYVGDYGNDRFQKFDSDGNYITQFPFSAGSYASYNKQLDLVMLSSFLAIDYTYEFIMINTDLTEVQYTFGFDSGSDPESFNSPRGTEWSKDGQTLYIANYNGNEVNKYNITAQPDLESYTGDLPDHDNSNSMDFKHTFGWEQYGTIDFVMYSSIIPDTLNALISWDLYNDSTPTTPYSIMTEQLVSVSITENSIYDLNELKLTINFHASSGGFDLSLTTYDTGLESFVTGSKVYNTSLFPSSEFTPYDYGIIKINYLYAKTAQIDSHIKSRLKYLSSTQRIHEIKIDVFDYRIPLKIYSPYDWNLTSTTPTIKYAWNSAGYYSMNGTIPTEYTFIFSSGANWGIEPKQPNIGSWKDVSTDYLDCVGFECGQVDDIEEYLTYVWGSIGVNTSVVSEGSFSIRLESPTTTRRILTISDLDAGRYYLSIDIFYESVSYGELYLYTRNTGGTSWTTQSLGDTSILNSWQKGLFYFETDGFSDSVRLDTTINFNGIVFIDNLRIWEPSQKTTNTGYNEFTTTGSLIALDGYLNPKAYNHAFDLEHIIRDSRHVLFHTTGKTDLYGDYSVTSHFTLPDREIETRIASKTSFWNYGEKYTETNDIWSTLAGYDMSDTLSNVDSKTGYKSLSVITRFDTDDYIGIRGTIPTAHNTKTYYGVKFSTKVNDTTNLDLTGNFHLYDASFSNVYYWANTINIGSKWEDTFYKLSDAPFGTLDVTTDIKYFQFEFYNATTTDLFYNILIDGFSLIEYQIDTETPSTSSYDLNSQATKDNGVDPNYLDFHENYCEYRYTSPIYYSQWECVDGLIRYKNLRTTVGAYLYVRYNGLSIDAEYVNTLSFRFRTNTSFVQSTKEEIQIYDGFWGQKVGVWDTNYVPANQWIYVEIELGVAYSPTYWTGTETEIQLLFDQDTYSNFANSSYVQIEIDYMSFFHKEVDRGHIFEFDEPMDPCSATLVISCTVDDWYVQSSTTQSVANSELVLDVSSYAYSGIKYISEERLLNYDYIELLAYADTTVSMRFRFENSANSFLANSDTFVLTTTPQRFIIPVTVEIKNLHYQKSNDATVTTVYTEYIRFVDSDGNSELQVDQESLLAYFDPNDNSNSLYQTWINGSGYGVYSAYELFTLPSNKNIRYYFTYTKFSSDLTDVLNYPTSIQLYNYTRLSEGRPPSFIGDWFKGESIEVNFDGEILDTDSFYSYINYDRIKHQIWVVAENFGTFLTFKLPYHWSNVTISPDIDISSSSNDYTINDIQPNVNYVITAFSGYDFGYDHAYRPDILAIEETGFLACPSFECGNWLEWYQVTDLFNTVEIVNDKSFDGEYSLHLVDTTSDQEYLYLDIVESGQYYVSFDYFVVSSDNYFYLNIPTGDGTATNNIQIFGTSPITGRWQTFRAYFEFASDSYDWIRFRAYNWIGEVYIDDFRLYRTSTTIESEGYSETSISGSLIHWDNYLNPYAQNVPIVVDFTERVNNLRLVTYRLKTDTNGEFHQIVKLDLERLEYSVKVWTKESHFSSVIGSSFQKYWYDWEDLTKWSGTTGESFISVDGYNDVLSFTSTSGQDIRYDFPSGGIQAGFDDFLYFETKGGYTSNSFRAYVDGANARDMQYRISDDSTVNEINFPFAWNPYYIDLSTTGSYTVGSFNINTWKYFIIFVITSSYTAYLRDFHMIHAVKTHFTPFVASHDVFSYGNTIDGKKAYWDYSEGAKEDISSTDMTLTVEDGYLEAYFNATSAGWRTIYLNNFDLDETYYSYFATRVYAFNTSTSFYVVGDGLQVLNPVSLTQSTWLQYSGAFRTDWTSNDISQLWFRLYTPASGVYVWRVDYISVEHHDAERGFQWEFDEDIISGLPDNTVGDILGWRGLVSQVTRNGYFEGFMSASTSDYFYTSPSTTIEPYAIEGSGLTIEIRLQANVNDLETLLIAQRNVGGSTTLGFQTVPTTLTTLTFTLDTTIYDFNGLTFRFGEIGGGAMESTDRVRIYSIRAVYIDQAPDLIIDDTNLLAYFGNDDNFTQYYQIWLNGINYGIVEEYDPFSLPAELDVDYIFEYSIIFVDNGFLIQIPSVVFRVDYSILSQLVDLAIEGITPPVYDVSGFLSFFVSTNWENTTVSVYQNGTLLGSVAELGTLVFAFDTTAGVYNFTYLIDGGSQSITFEDWYTIAETDLSLISNFYDIVILDIDGYIFQDFPLLTYYDGSIISRNLIELRANDTFDSGLLTFGNDQLFTYSALNVTVQQSFSTNTFVVLVYMDLIKLHFQNAGTYTTELNITRTVGNFTIDRNETVVIPTGGRDYWLPTGNYSLQVFEKIPTGVNDSVQLSSKGFIDFLGVRADMPSRSFDVSSTLVGTSVNNDVSFWQRDSVKKTLLGSSIILLFLLSIGGNELWLWIKINIFRKSKDESVFQRNSNSDQSSSSSRQKSMSSSSRPKMR